jgi:hypothetical protein
MMRDPSNSPGGDDHLYLARQLSVFYTSKPTKGVPEVVDYVVDDRDREIENSKIRARHRRQDLYRFG